jgi:hypothetical protein
METFETKPFEPSVLIVKQHNKTGLRYFHKTKKIQFVESYCGSGVYWLKHLEKHGNDWTNIWVSEVFYDKEDIVEFATFFSEFFEIVESKEWANLCIENGINGGDLTSEEATERNNKRVKNGTHPFLNSNTQSKLASRGNKKRILAGTHPFQDSEKARERQHRQIANGTNNWAGEKHPAKKKYLCSVTGKTGNKGTFGIWAKKQGHAKWPHPLELIYEPSRHL